MVGTKCCYRAVLCAMLACAACLAVGDASQALSADQPERAVPEEAGEDKAEGSQATTPEAQEGVVEEPASPPAVPDVAPDLAPPDQLAPGLQDGLLGQPEAQDAGQTARPFASVAAGASFSQIAFGGTSVVNMMGDLLGATSSVSYQIFGTGMLPNGGSILPRPAVIEAFGAINLRNAKVAENNSPLPRDRVSLRYNHFHNATDVTGFTTDDPTLVPQLPGTIPPTVNLFGQQFPLPLEIVGLPFPDLVQLESSTRSYHEELVTFSVEQMFANGLASIELRVPISRGVSSDLGISTGELVGLGFGSFDVVPTPEQTLGHESTEIGNMTLILKGLLCESQKTAVAGGLGVGIPSGKDTRVTVNDFGSSVLVFDGAQAGRPDVPGPRFIQFPLDTRRERLIEVKNETVTASPFLAAVHAPSERLYFQGFAQVEVPTNQNEANFTRNFDLATFSLFNLAGFPEENAELRETHELREQTLLHLDVGMGYWLYRNPHNCFCKGLAGLLELHYTTTLNDADIVAIPTPFGAFRLIESVQEQMIIPEPIDTIIGNRANRLDILNLTVGGTALLGDRFTLAAACVLPLRDGNDKLFDWEANVQLNYFIDPGQQTPTVR